MKIIEFAGLPKAGKTTLMARTAVRLRRQGFSVKKISDESAKSPVDHHEVFFHQAWILHRVIEKLQDATNKKYDFVLVNCGIVDRLVNTLVLQKYKLLSYKQARVVVEYFSYFLPLEDMVLYLDISPELSLKRNKGKQGRLLNKKYLILQRRRYRRYLPVFATRFASLDASQDINHILDEIVHIVGAFS